MITVKTQPFLGQRIAATIIDYFIIIVFSVAFVMFFGEPDEEGAMTVSGPLALIPGIFWFCWLIIPESIWGKTPGHYSAGLKIITVEGNKPVFWQALVRRTCDIIDISCCFGLIAFILVQTNKNNQRLGDILAKTLVVDKDHRTEEAGFEFEKLAQNQ